MTPGCPLCGDQNYSIFYKQVPQFPDADIVKCDRCGHLYTILRKEIDVNNLYTNDDEVYKVVENRDSIFDRIITGEYTGVIGKLNKIAGRKGRLLDFGCGKGKFGSLAKADGWEVKCVETSADRAAYARTVYGLEVNTDLYAGGTIFDKPCKTLTLFHVLEHLPQPGALLGELIGSNTEKDGIIIIEVPNVNSWQSALAGDKWIHLDVPRDIHHFTPERLERFLRELGLQPVKTNYFSFHLGVLGMVDSLLKLFGYRKNIIYELKNKKSKSLLIKVALLLPAAYLLERIASALRKGGIIRMYLTRV